jgi:hypothetical protein
VQLCETDRAALSGFVRILDAHRDCTTPAEEFILDIVEHHAYGGWASITPDSIMEDLKTFRADFEDAIEAAKLHVRNYPAYVLGGPDCKKKYHEQRARMWEIARGVDEVPEGTKAQVLSYIEIARLCLREFPALVLSDESPEEIVKQGAV